MTHAPVPRLSPGTQAPLRRGQVWLVVMWMVGLLSGALRGQESEPHPLASLARRLPQHGPITQLADLKGQPLALFGDPEGRGLRLGGAGDSVWVATGLPGIEQIAGGSGPWLARAAGKLWYGTDGQTWVESLWPGPKEPAQLRRLNGKFYAWSAEYYESAGPGQGSIFYGPRLYRSLDGMQWQELEIAVLSRRINDIRDIFHHNGRYFLCCYGSTQENGDSVGIGCLTSEDAISWSRVEGINFHTTGAAFGGGQWLLTGQGYGQFAVSTDGVNWTTHRHSFISNYLTSGIGNSSPVYSDMTYPIWIESGFHCLTSIYPDKPVVAVSRDGITWQAAEPLSWNDTPGSLSQNSPFSPRTGGLSAIGGKAWWWGKSATVWSSNDWIWGGTREWPEESGNFFSVAASSEHVVALADNGRVAMSENGRIWTFHDLPGDVVPSDVVWAADLGEFLAVGDRLADIQNGRVAQPHVWRSLDGRTWGVRRFTAPSVNVRAIARGMGKYVAIADRSMPYSTDGVEWRGFTPLPREVRFRDVAFGNNQFLVVDERGGLFLSLDGVTWNPAPTPFATTSLQGSIAVSHTGDGWLLTGKSVSYFSADLVEWIPSSPGISFAQGEFIDDTGSASSSDAQTWHRRRLSGTLSDDLLWHPQRVAFRNSVLTFGSNGQISQSGDWRDYVGEWKGEQFTGVELAQPAIAGDDADPDRDGLGNLLEYALGLNPKRADAQDGISYGEDQLDVGWGTPQPTTKFSFPSGKDSYGVKLRVEFSDDLIVWKLGDPEAHRISEASTTTEIRERIAIHHLIGSRPSKWMRLRASR